MTAPTTCPAATRSEFPWMDAFTTALSLGAQILQNRKKLEHWFFWITADLFYVYLYIARDLWLTSILYAIFLAMCIAGLRAWRDELPALRLPASRTWAIADIRAALAQVEQLVARQPVAGAGSKVRGAELRFAAGSDASVTVRGETERLLMADDEGRVLLMLDGDLADAREIELSRTPEVALPWLGR